MHLDELRLIRNRLVHSGGYITDNEEERFRNIKGISLVGSLIIIDDNYVWDALEHAKEFLLGVAHA